CVGLGFSVYAVLLGVSGSLLVFREELTALEFPQFQSGTAEADLKTTPDQALAAARAAYPGWQAYSVTWPNATSPHWMAYVGKGSETAEVFVDARTGQVVGGRNTREGAVGTIAQVHFNLLLGSRAGHVVQSYGVAALLMMCASGLWLWWPVGGARLGSRFRVDVRGGWRRLFWQLHHVTGAVGVAFIGMWAVTGGYYLWLNPYIAVVDHFFERAKTPQLQKRAAEMPLLTMQQLADRAGVEFPGRPLYRMATPFAPDQSVSVTLLEATPGEFHRVATVVLDPVTGAVLQKGASVDRPMGNSILAWISVLHFGRFGGLAVKVLWALMGLTLPLLAVTGCLMWWRRVIEPQLRRVPAKVAVAS
ncbi:MAG: PepSY-associated TM helix domain-containing protein, partial [Acidobacteriota bacterium]